MSRLLTGLLLSAIILCIGCEKPPAKAEWPQYAAQGANVKSRENARWRATTPSPKQACVVDVYEVIIDGDHYLIASGYDGVSIIPKTRPPQVAERVQ